MKKVKKFLEHYMKLLTNSIMETDMKNLNQAALQILKTIELEELRKQFKFVKISISTIFRFKKMLVYQFGLYQELMHEHRESLHRY